MTREQRSRLRELEAIVVNRLRVDLDVELASRKGGGSMTREESIAVVEQLLRTDPQVRAAAERILAAS